MYIHYSAVMRRSRFVSSASFAALTQEFAGGSNGCSRLEVSETEMFRHQ